MFSLLLYVLQLSLVTLFFVSINVSVSPNEGFTVSRIPSPSLHFPPPLPVVAASTVDLAARRALSAFCAFVAL